MGSQISSPAKSAVGADGNSSRYDDISRFKSFPGSAILEKTFCGSIDTTDPAEYQDGNFTSRILKRAEILCVSSPISSSHTDDGNFDENNSLRSYFSHPSDHGGDGSPMLSPSQRPIHPSSAMFARALVSEVTDNPKTMKPADMALREKKLLKAQEAANRIGISKSGNGTGAPSGDREKKTGGVGVGIPTSSRPIGTPGGVGPPNVLGSLAYACTGDETAANLCSNDDSIPSSTRYPNSGNNGFPFGGDNHAGVVHPPSPFQVTIGLSLSRRHSGIGHPDTITRQTAYDFNELQDRQYKYVSSTDQYGWRAGGGEPGDIIQSVDSDLSEPGSPGIAKTSDSQPQPIQQHEKIASPDIVHIPIIHIDCPNAEAVDGVITALASGEIFIPHMSIIPEALCVAGISPPDLVLRFGCERNDDVPPDDWPNWCLEFMHNQLYEYFYSYGARWMKRPFSITMARSVRWKTVKHMNRYFAHAEKVIETWREKGPQMLDPQLSYIDGGATPEEVSKPHGIYLFRSGGASRSSTPTNYFCPNFDPPYTTKMTRSLLMAVLSKSWDKKRREWTSEPIARLVEPASLISAALGCTDSSAGGYLAKEATTTGGTTVNADHNRHIVPESGALSSHTPKMHKSSVDSVVSTSKAQHAEFQSMHPQHSHTNQKPIDKSANAEKSEIEFGVVENELEMNENKVSMEDLHQSEEQLLVMRVMGVSNGPKIGKFKDNLKDESIDEDDSNPSEEKKSDDPIAKSSRLGSFIKRSLGRSKQSYSKHNSMNSSFTTDEDGPLSVTASAYDTSVAASGTTVHRANTTSNKQSKLGPRGTSDKRTEQQHESQAESATDQRKLYSDEDWDQVGSSPRVESFQGRSQQTTFVNDDDGDTDDFDELLSAVPPTDRMNLHLRPQESSTSLSNELLEKETHINSSPIAGKSGSNVNKIPSTTPRQLQDGKHQTHGPTNNKSIVGNISAHFSSASSTSTNDDSEDEENRDGRYGPNYALVQQQRNSPREAMIREQQSQHQLNNDMAIRANNKTAARSDRDNTITPLHDPQGRSLDRGRVDGVSYVMPHTFKVGSGKGNLHDGAIVEQTFSGMSLEYSTDGSSLFLLNDQGSSNSLVGQNLINQSEVLSSIGLGLSKTSSSHDSEILGKGEAKRNKNDIMLNKFGNSTGSSSDDNDSLLRDGSSRGGVLFGVLDSNGDSTYNSQPRLEKPPSHNALKSAHNAKQQSVRIPHQSPEKKISSYPSREDTDSTANMSVQESESYATSTSVVPTDEELYAIGWAKAFDASSGNYYYFTLDRSKTVWDNPLAAQDGNSSAWSNSDVSNNNLVLAGSKSKSPTENLHWKQQPVGRMDP